MQSCWYKPPVTNERAGVIPTLQEIVDFPLFKKGFCFSICFFRPWIHPIILFYSAQYHIGIAHLPMWYGREPNFVYFLTYFRNKKTQNLSTFSKRLSHFSLISKVLRLTKDRKISFNEVKTTTRVDKSMSSSCEYLVLLGK